MNLPHLQVSARIPLKLLLLLLLRLVLRRVLEVERSAHPPHSNIDNRVEEDQDGEDCCHLLVALRAVVYVTVTRAEILENEQVLDREGQAKHDDG